MATYEITPSAAAQIVAMSMGGAARPRLREGVAKLSPDGRPTFASGVVVAREDGQGQERGVSIAVIESTVLPMGALVRPDGKTWVTPYVTDAGRVGVSIVTERLVAAKPARPDRAAVAGEGA